MQSGAGLHLLPFLKGEKEYLVLIKCNYDTVWAGERAGVRGSGIASYSIKRIQR
jgi:hypothetical protein